MEARSLATPDTTHQTPLVTNNAQYCLAKFLPKASQAWGQNISSTDKSPHSCFSSLFKWKIPPIYGKTAASVLISKPANVIYRSYYFFFLVFFLKASRCCQFLFCLIKRKLTDASTRRPSENYLDWSFSRWIRMISESQRSSCTVKIKNTKSLKPSREQQPFFTPATCTQQSSKEAGSTILIRSSVDWWKRCAVEH